MNTPDKLDLETTEKLLDVVFGVIIGLSLLKLPEAIGNVVSDPNPTEWNRVLLLFTGLLFGAFYWLESRHFILKQHIFNREIQRIDTQNRDGVPLPLASFLLGILGLMGFASAQLAFADQGDFLKFSYAAGMFWCFDLLGTYLLKREYKKERMLLDLTDDQVSEGERWFLGHIVSPFFYFYGAGNLLIFLLGICVVQHLQAPDLGEIIFCGLYLAATLVRHLFVRSALLEKVTDIYQIKIAGVSQAVEVPDSKL